MEKIKVNEFEITLNGIRLGTITEDILLIGFQKWKNLWRFEFINWCDNEYSVNYINVSDLKTEGNGKTWIMAGINLIKNMIKRR